MLCSISTGGKPGPSWLDRLRSAKGFPAGTDGDLEHFLNRNPCSGTGKNELESSSGSVPLDEKQIERTKKSEIISNDHRNRRKDEDWFNIMSTVLAELFVMGDPSDFTRTRKIGDAKSSRKQQNPRFCEFSSSASVDDFTSNGAQRSDGVPAMSPSSADNSVAGVKETTTDVAVGLKTKTKKNKKKKKKKNGSAGASAGAWSTEEEEEEERFEADRYTRVDVTIIDTSAAVWKSEKVVFRKGSVWKVRDKKSKCRRISSLRKKRKASHFDEEIGAKKKKKKKKKEKQKLSPDVKSTGEDIVSSIEGFPSTEKGKSSEMNPENLNQVPKTRQIFSRSPRKPAKRNSFHIQSVSSSKKIWGTPSKKLS